MFGLNLATEVSTNWLHIILFFIGSVAMRSCGCVINDLWDKDFDAKVDRTKNRPLASGAINIKQALLFILLLLLISLLVVIFLPKQVFIISLFSLPLVILYPLMKRITYLPQIFLGITFNFGILMGYAATGLDFNYAVFIAYLGFISWTIGYDTIYAHQDKKDDKKIGVKSTALLFGDNSKKIVAILYIIFVSLLVVSGDLAGKGFVYYAGLLLVSVLLAKQIINWNINNPNSCAINFKDNIWIGLILAII